MIWSEKVAQWGAEEVEEDSDLHRRVRVARPGVGGVIQLSAGRASREAGNDGESGDDQNYYTDGDQHETLRVHEPESTERLAPGFVAQDAG